MKIATRSLVFCITLLLAASAATPGNAAKAASPDPAAMKLLVAVQTKLASIQSLSAICTTVTDCPPAGELRSKEVIQLKRPNYFQADDREQYKNQAGTKPINFHITALGDGKRVWEWSSSDNEYRAAKEDPTGKDLASNVPVINGIFNPKESYAAHVKQAIKDGSFVSLNYVGTRAWNGARYKVVDLSVFDRKKYPETLLKKIPGGKVMITTSLYIDGDFLVHRATDIFTTGWRTDSQIQDIVINPALAKVSFAFIAPTGAQLAPATPPSDQSSPLLANGVVAPNFTVQNTAGNWSVRLSDFKHKVVVLDFWATWCGPCQESLPHTNAVAAKFKGKNVVFLAVNVWDSEDAFKAWLPVHKQYNALKFLIDPRDQGKDIASSLYHVDGIPTQYVIGKNGKITAHFVGYDGPTPDLEKAVNAALAAP